MSKTEKKRNLRPLEGLAPDPEPKKRTVADIPDKPDAPASKKKKSFEEFEIEQKNKRKSRKSKDKFKLNPMIQTNVSGKKFKKGGKIRDMFTEQYD
jgi:hypothetical protein